MARPKKQRADSVTAMVSAMQAAAEGDVVVPDHVHLRDGDYPYWISVVRARAKTEWTEADLVAAGNLARCMSDVERLQKEIDAEGDQVENGKGTPVMNPKHALLEILSRRQIALFRLLQMQSVTSGELKNKVVARKSERQAREVARTLEDDLIPTS